MCPSADLAARLLTSQSTVNRVIERLRDTNLIHHQRYIGVQLTEKGLKEALTLLRKQAIIESFLMTVMAFKWPEIYEEARRMRHNISESVLNRMWEMAGSPTYSPFGEPITEQEIIPEEIALADADHPDDYEIARVLTRQIDRLAYLEALGLQPGSRFHLLHKAPFNGPMQLHLGREYRIIGHELAKLLTVKPAHS